MPCPHDALTCWASNGVVRRRFLERSGPPWGRGERALVGVLAAVAVSGVLVATRHGMALSPDSVTYLSIARNVAAGHGFVDFTGVAETTFPPGFPAMIALGKFMGLSLTSSARAVNAGSFALIVVLSWVLLRRHTSSRGVRVWALVLVACSPILLNVSAEAWSEPMFCVLVLAFVVVMEDVARTAASRPWSVLSAGLIAGASFLVRYVGVSLLVTGVIVCATSPASMTIRRRVTRAAGFGLVAVALPVLWLVRNATSGSPYLLGPRVALPGIPWIVVRRFVTSAEPLVAPTNAPVVFAVCAIPVAVGVALGIVAARRRSRSINRRVPSGNLTPTAIFIVVYAIILLTAGKLSGASVDTRTVMPLYLPAILVVVGLVESARSVEPDQAATRFRHAGVRAVGTSAVACLSLVVVAFTTAAWNDGRAARGYGSATARPASVAQVVQHLDARALVVTNHAWTLYHATGHEPIVPTPAPLYPSVSIVPATLDELGDQVCARPVYLAWFNHAALPDQTPHLGDEVVLQPLTQRADGTLYKMVPAPSNTCTPEES